NDGVEFPLPYNGPGAVGQGKPLRSIVHPAGSVEIWFGSGGPQNVALAAEVCDGLLPMGASGDALAATLQRGFDRREGGRPEHFEVFGGVSVTITDDVQATL